MSYTITPSSEGKYIIHKVKREINRRTAFQQSIEVPALGRELGIDRILIDVTEARNTDSAPQAYDFAYTDMIGAEGINKNAIVAVLAMN